jgi:hypothetical protein
MSQDGGATQQSSEFGWKVPLTRKQTQAVLDARPAGWEFLLWAGALKQNTDILESQYLDHAAGLAPRTTTPLITDAHTYLDFIQTSSQEGLRIMGNFNAVLSPDVQTAAFGEPGEPGDPDRIQHFAQRLADLYRDLMDWSANLRGAPVRGEHAHRALVAFANASNGNVERYRAFVHDAVTWADGISQPREPDEVYAFEFTIVMDLDDDFMAEHQRERDLALDMNDPTHIF